MEGCLVVELRNHRGYHNSSGKYSRHYFLLRPTAEVGKLCVVFMLRICVVGNFQMFNFKFSEQIRNVDRNYISYMH